MSSTRSLSGLILLLFLFLHVILVSAINPPTHQQHITLNEIYFRAPPSPDFMMHRVATALVELVDHSAGDFVDEGSVSQQQEPHQRSRRARLSPSQDVMFWFKERTAFLRRYNNNAPITTPMAFSSPPPATKKKATAEKQRSSNVDLVSNMKKGGNVKNSKKEIESGHLANSSSEDNRGEFLFLKYLVIENNFCVSLGRNEPKYRLESACCFAELIDVFRRKGGGGALKTFNDVNWVAVDEAFTRLIVDSATAISKNTSLENDENVGNDVFKAPRKDFHDKFFDLVWSVLGKDVKRNHVYMTVLYNYLLTRITSDRDYKAWGPILTEAVVAVADQFWDNIDFYPAIRPLLYRTAFHLQKSSKAHQILDGLLKNVSCDDLLSTISSSIESPYSASMMMTTDLCLLKYLLFYQQQKRRPLCPLLEDYNEDTMTKILQALSSRVYRRSSVDALCLRSIMDCFPRESDKLFGQDFWKEKIKNNLVFSCIAALVCIYIAKAAIIFLFSSLNAHVIAGIFSGSSGFAIVNYFFDVALQYNLLIALIFFVIYFVTFRFSVILQFLREVSAICYWIIVTQYFLPFWPVILVASGLFGTLQIFLFGMRRWDLLLVLHLSVFALYFLLPFCFSFVLRIPGMLYRFFFLQVFSFLYKYIVAEYLAIRWKWLLLGSLIFWGFHGLFIAPTIAILQFVLLHMVGVVLYWVAGPILRFVFRILLLFFAIVLMAYLFSTNLENSLQFFAYSWKSNKVVEEYNKAAEKYVLRQYMAIDSLENMYFSTSFHSICQLRHEKLKVKKKSPKTSSGDKSDNNDATAKELVLWRKAGKLEESCNGGEEGGTAEEEVWQQKSLWEDSRGIFVHNRALHVAVFNKPLRSRGDGIFVIVTANFSVGGEEINNDENDAGETSLTEERSEKEEEEEIFQSKKTVASSHHYSSILPMRSQIRRPVYCKDCSPGILEAEKCPGRFEHDPGCRNTFFWKYQSQHATFWLIFFTEHPNLRDALRYSERLLVCGYCTFNEHLYSAHFNLNVIGEDVHQLTAQDDDGDEDATTEVVNQNDEKGGPVGYTVSTVSTVYDAKNQSALSVFLVGADDPVYVAPEALTMLAPMRSIGWGLAFFAFAWLPFLLYLLFKRWVLLDENFEANDEETSAMLVSRDYMLKAWQEKPESFLRLTQFLTVMTGMLCISAVLLLFLDHEVYAPERPFPLPQVRLALNLTNTLRKRSFSLYYYQGQNLPRSRLRRDQDRLAAEKGDTVEYFWIFGDKSGMRLNEGELPSVIKMAGDVTAGGTVYPANTKEENSQSRKEKKLVRCLFEAHHQSGDSLCTIEERSTQADVIVTAIVAGTAMKVTQQQKKNFVLSTETPPVGSKKATTKQIFDMGKELGLIIRALSLLTGIKKSELHAGQAPVGKAGMFIVNDGGKALKSSKKLGRKTIPEMSKIGKCSYELWKRIKESKELPRPACGSGYSGRGAYSGTVFGVNEDSRCACYVTQRVYTHFSPYLPRYFSNEAAISEEKDVAPRCICQNTKCNEVFPFGHICNSNATPPSGFGPFLNESEIEERVLQLQGDDKKKKAVKNMDANGEKTKNKKEEIVGYIHGMCVAMIHEEDLRRRCTKKNSKNKNAETSSLPTFCKKINSTQLLSAEIVTGNGTDKTASCFGCATYMFANGQPPSAIHLSSAESWVPPINGLISAEQHFTLRGINANTSTVVDDFFNHWKKWISDSLFKGVTKMREKENLIPGKHHWSQLANLRSWMLMGKNIAGADYEKERAGLFLDVLALHEKISARLMRTLKMD